MKKKVKKKLLPGIILGLLIILIIVLIKVLNKPNIKTYDKYSMSIIIETVKNGGKEEKKTFLEIKDDSKIAQVNTSFKTNPVYVNESGIFYEEDGRIKKINSKHSYRDIYSIISKIKVDNKDGNYHPNISKEIINELLDSLFIDYEMHRDAVGNMTIRDGVVEEFSIYLREFYGYDKLGIVITFEEIDENFKVKTPVFYKEVTDKIKEEELRFIN